MHNICLKIIYWKKVWILDIDRFDTQKSRTEHAHTEKENISQMRVLCAI